jgi:hypothetical protein
MIAASLLILTAVVAYGLFELIQLMRGCKRDLKSIEAILHRSEKRTVYTK